MLSLLHDLQPALYTHRSYVVSSGDDFSASKAAEFESRLRAVCNGSMDAPVIPSSYDISVIPRARKIHQPLWTTPLSALRCFLACFTVLRAPNSQDSQDKHSPGLNQKGGLHGSRGAFAYAYPDLIIANGPATAVLVIVTALLLRFFDVRGTQGKMRSIYVESWARVNTLSLSGRILVAGGMVNRMLVQWDTLARRGQGEFRGALVR
ncbi:MAG: hypothetical protein Q9174_002157 [Haloplaca sp. 1 TL-2023]